MARVFLESIFRLSDVSFCPFILLLLHSSRFVFPQSLPPEYAFNNRVIDKSASCDRSFIYFTVSFARPFLGLIYTEGSFGSQRCTYVNGSIFSQIRYNITIPLNECRSQTFPNGSSQNVIVVQRDWRILEASDNLFVITCTASIGGDTGSNLSSGGKFTLSFAGVTVQGGLASTELVTSSFSDIDYTAQVIFGAGPIGRKLDRPLAVGESISYVVRLRKLRPGQLDARIGRCWATDGAASSASAQNTEIQLSDDEGCTVLPGSNIWNNFQSTPLNEGEDGKVLYNDIKAWAFPTSNRVNIFCNLHLCPLTCPSSPCQQNGPTGTPALSIFTSPSSSPTRNSTEKAKSKREATDDLDEENEMVRRISTGYEIVSDRRLQDEHVQQDSLLVRAQLTAPRGEGKEMGTAKTVCMTYTNFIVGVSLLLLIILLSFLFIVALLCKLFRGGSPKWRFSRDRVQTIFSARTISFRRSSTEAETIARRSPDADSESAVTNSTAARAYR